MQNSEDMNDRQNVEMIDFKEIKDGETWELFARDFLTEMGFYVESSVDRGPDGKKDLIVNEQLKGNLNNYKFKWLVSCKHFANRNSANSVREEDEPNILERVESFKCDGFIGFYSTVPSSGLNTRLTQLKDNGNIKDYRVFDYKLIENYLITIGYSELLMRYFPSSYKMIKPLHLIFNQYLPLECKCCNTDLLKRINEDAYTGLIAFVYKDETITTEQEENHVHNQIIEDIYWACKGDCDGKINDSIKNQHKYTGWVDIDDLVIPAHFIKWVLAVMNCIESGKDKYTPEAYKKLKYFIMAISQKVMREMTKKEKERFLALLEIDNLLL
jgi:hypothetical protein